MQLSSYLKLTFRARIFFRSSRKHHKLHKIRLVRHLERIVTISETVEVTLEQAQLIIRKGVGLRGPAPVSVFADRKGRGDLIPKSMVFARAGDKDEGIDPPWIYVTIREAVP